jgi:hypothetical protein
VHPETPQIVSSDHEATMVHPRLAQSDDSATTRYTQEIGAVPVHLEGDAVPAERSQESGVLNQSSIVPQVSTDDEDDGLYQIGKAVVLVCMKSI